MRAVRHGEASELRERFRAVVITHQHVVHAVIAQLLFRGTVADVEDLAQETFVRVYRALPRFEWREPAQLKRWIVTIAARVAIDQLRIKRVPIEPFDETLHRISPHGADELTRLRKLGDRIEAVLAELGEEQRSVVVLRQLHGLDYQEIADALELDLGTVKSRLHRARAKLQQALLEEQSG